jgi:hypothetical protein
VLKGEFGFYYIELCVEQVAEQHEMAYVMKGHRVEWMPVCDRWFWCGAVTIRSAGPTEEQDLQLASARHQPSNKSGEIIETQRTNICLSDKRSKYILKKYNISE